MFDNGLRVGAAKLRDGKGQRFVTRTYQIFQRRRRQESHT